MLYENNSIKKTDFRDSEVVTVKDSDPREMKDNDELHDVQALAFFQKKIFMDKWFAVQA